jgi:hypothetical protein
MQLTLTSSAVLATLLVPHAATARPAPSAAAPPHARPTAELVSLPPTSPCPAYLGPQCDSVEHELFATGQDIAALGLGRLTGHRH